MICREHSVMLWEDLAISSQRSFIESFFAFLALSLSADAFCGIHQISLGRLVFDVFDFVNCCCRVWGVMVQAETATTKTQPRPQNGPVFVQRVKSFCCHLFALELHGPLGQSPLAGCSLYPVQFKQATSKKPLPRRKQSPHRTVCTKVAAC